MKRCSKCGEEKSEEEFYARHYWCKKCDIEYMKRPESRRKDKERRTRWVEQKGDYIDAYKREHPCVDCGEKDIDVLEFDHVRGKKRRGISDMKNRSCSLETLKKEIKKCDVRCSNCHRKRHIKERFHKTVLNEEK